MKAIPRTREPPPKTRTSNLPYKSGPAELFPTKGTPGSHHSRLRRVPCLPTLVQPRVSTSSLLSPLLSMGLAGGSRHFCSRTELIKSTIKPTSPGLFLFIVRYFLNSPHGFGSALGGHGPELDLNCNCLLGP